MGSSQSLQSAVEIVSQWHSEPRERLIFDCDRIEISQYLQAVDKVQQSADNNDLKDIISMAVSRLKLEFQAILTRQTESVMGPSSITELSTSITDSTSYQFRYEDYVVYEAPSKQVIVYLRSIVERMDSCGHLGTCIEVYKRVRKCFVDTIFKRLRLEELQAGDTTRFLPEELKMKIERWIQAARVCVKLLFAKEKQLAMQIFGGLGTSTVDGCFLHTVKDTAINLFTFAETVSSSRQSYERLEIILILYEAFFSLSLDTKALFQIESANGITNNTAAILSRLQDDVRRMVSDFENNLLRDVSMISDDKGGVHQPTRYAMQCINLIVKYRKPLKNIMVAKPSMTIGDWKMPDEKLQNPESFTPLALHLVLILEVLQFNLENKSKYYKNASLGYVFMMNNVQYIVQKVEGSRELQEMVGADYVKKLNENVKQAMTGYQALNCDRFLDCLRDDGLYVSQCFSYGVSKSALRKRIKTFHGLFEEMQLSQTSWQIPDLILREELRKSMSEKLLPAYECFLKKFKSHLEPGKQRKACIQYFQKIHIKYSLQDFETLVLKDLFECYQLCPLPEVPPETFHLGGGYVDSLVEIK